MPAGSPGTSSENGASSQELWEQVDAWIEEVLRDAGAGSDPFVSPVRERERSRSVLEQLLLGQLVADAIADALAPALASALAPRVVKLLEHPPNDGNGTGAPTSERKEKARTAPTASGAKTGHNGGG